MMIWLMRLCGVALAAVAIVAVDESRAQDPFGDAQAMIEFQRAADSYAFGHRQTERRGTTPATAVEGAFFTPQVAAAFRVRIRTAARAPGCDVSAAGVSSVVPRVNATIEGTPAAPACLTAILPKLPTELEYRMAGVALVLADAHLHLVIDVLHAAFP